MGTRQLGAAMTFGLIFLFSGSAIWAGVTLCVRGHTVATHSAAAKSPAPERVIKTPPMANPAATKEVLEKFTMSPALFVENVGQSAGESVRFIHRGQGANVFLTDDGITFQSCGTAAPACAFSASFPASIKVRPEGLGESKARFNYFVGDDPTQWQMNAPTFEKVVYRNLYPGIDLVVHGLRSHLKYEFIVATGADPRQIQVAYAGIDGLSISADGRLRVQTPLGEMLEDAPYIYQEKNGAKVQVAGGFRLLSSCAYTVSVTGAYDPTRALVIDPDLTWSTFLGGSGVNQGFGITADGGGNVYATGRAMSADFPTLNGWDTTYNGNDDAFVTKFSADGSLLWSTYLGGSEWDNGIGIAVDGTGNAYVTGFTKSDDFPTPNGWDTTYNGGDNGCNNYYGDAFVAKLGADGSLLWSTYLGGSRDEAGVGIAVDGTGNAYVTGPTGSSNFPTLDGWDTTYNGGEDWGGDAFVSKFSTDGSLLWSTYLGGSSNDFGYGIAADTTGNACVTGMTYSTDFPTANGWDETRNGGWDAFVAEFSASGSLLWSTYLGGNSSDYGRGIAVDTTGNAYVTGMTYSTDFPTPNGWDTTQNGDEDAFVAKFSSDGSLLWSTYLGGSGLDEGKSIAVDGTGNVYLTGMTCSTDVPMPNTWDSTFNGIEDAFVAKLSADGPLLWFTYLGGSGYDDGCGIVVDNAGNAYVTGWTDSADFPTLNGWDTTMNGWSDAFLAKFGNAPEPLTLDVDSTPITGVAITGTPVGTTDYEAYLAPDAAVTLQALAKGAGGYVFLRWGLDGAYKTCGDRTLKFSINHNSTATASYKLFRWLTITGPTIVNESSKARYVCKLYCKDGTSYKITPYAIWRENSRYARFVKPGVLKISSVPSRQRVRLSATYGGRTRYFYITIRNTRWGGGISDSWFGVREQRHICRRQSDSSDRSNTSDQSD